MESQKYIAFKYFLQNNGVFLSSTEFVFSSKVCVLFTRYQEKQFSSPLECCLFSLSFSSSMINQKFTFPNNIYFLSKKHNCFYLQNVCKTAHI